MNQAGLKARLYVPSINRLAWLIAIDAGIRLIARSRSHAATGLLHCATAPKRRDARTMLFARAMRRSSY